MNELFYHSNSHRTPGLTRHESSVSERVLAFNPLLAGLPGATAPVTELDVLIFRFITQFRERLTRDPDILNHASDTRHGNNGPVIEQVLNKVVNSNSFGLSIRTNQKISMSVPGMPGKA